MFFPDGATIQDVKIHLYGPITTTGTYTGVYCLDTEIAHRELKISAMSSDGTEEYIGERTNLEGCSGCGLNTFDCAMEDVAKDILKDKKLETVETRYGITVEIPTPTETRLYS